MKITIKPYDPRWKDLFSVEKETLERILAAFQPIIEHVGSTSVQGLAAKPIVDIMVGLQEVSQLDAAVEPLLPQGYIYHRKYDTVMPHRRFFVKMHAASDVSDLPTIVDQGMNLPERTYPLRAYQIHMVAVDSDFWTDHLLFRDYLRVDTVARNDYLNVKLRLAQRDWTNANEYSEAKSACILSILEKARATSATR